MSDKERQKEERSSDEIVEETLKQRSMMSVFQERL